MNIKKFLAITLAYMAGMLTFLLFMPPFHWWSVFTVIAIALNLWMSSDDIERYVQDRMKSKE